MKRLVVCCDGTWQSLKKEAYPTNIFTIAQALKPVTYQDGNEVEQVIYYDHGIGSGDLTGDVDWGEKYTRGLFGKGIDHKIQDAYFFLCENYVPGDEIYLFGFSRGAYTVRSLAGLINCSGLLSHENLRKVPDAYELYRNHTIEPTDPKAVNFRRENGERVIITLLACFETVGALGIPDIVPFIPVDKWINAKYKFHDTKVSSIVKNALHAVAIDEVRKAYDVTPMTKEDEATEQVIKEVWFSGEHGCVGGGHQEHGLSDVALQWMVKEIQNLGLGLEFNDNILYKKVKPDPCENPCKDFDYKLHRIIDRLTGKKLRSLPKDAILHPSVQARRECYKDYYPYNIKGLL